MSFVFWGLFVAYVILIAVFIVSQAADGANKVRKTRKMTHFYQTMKISTPEDLLRLVAFLFAVLWVVWSLKARQSRRHATGTAFIAPHHASSHLIASYDKRHQQKNSFTRSVEMSQIAMILAASVALTTALGLELYSRLTQHRFYFGNPTILFMTGFLCGAIYLIYFAVRELFALRRR